LGLDACGVTPRDLTTQSISSLALRRWGDTIFPPRRYVRNLDLTSNFYSNKVL
jgi:hypothetical protein